MHLSDYAVAGRGCKTQPQTPESPPLAQFPDASSDSAVEKVLDRATAKVDKVVQSPVLAVSSQSPAWGGFHLSTIEP